MNLMMTFTRLLLAGAITLGSLATAHAAENPYSFVNAGLQMSHAAEQRFAVYLGIWRQVSADERKLAAQSQNAALVANRTVAWTVCKCDSSKPFVADQENFWFLDQIRINSEGDAVPLPQAGRWNHMYFSMLNFNSMHAKLIGPHVPPKRLPDEKYEPFQLRKKQAYQAWLEQNSMKNLRGQISVKATHDFYDSFGETERSQFYDIEPYKLPEHPLYATFRRFAPHQWPVHYDERDHKLHTLQWTPTDPNLKSHLRSHQDLEFWVEWDWCDGGNVPSMRVTSPMQPLPQVGEPRRAVDPGSQSEFSIEPASERPQTCQ